MFNIDWSCSSKINCWIREITWFLFTCRSFWQSSRSEKENGVIKVRLYERQIKWSSTAILGNQPWPFFTGNKQFYSKIKIT